MPKSSDQSDSFTVTAWFQSDETSSSPYGCILAALSSDGLTMCYSICIVKQPDATAAVKFSYTTSSQVILHLCGLMTSSEVVLKFGFGFHMRNNVENLLQVFSSVVKYTFCLSSLHCNCICWFTSGKFSS